MTIDTNPPPPPKPCEVAIGRVLITPEGPDAYKVVFRLGNRVLSEHPVSTVREGEVLIRSELATIQFSAQDKRPDPEAPNRKTMAADSTATV